jgi:hypothetical protein
MSLLVVAPRAWRLFRERRQDSSTIETERCLPQTGLVRKRGDGLRDTGIPEIGGFVHGSPSGPKQRAD